MTSPRLDARRAFLRIAGLGLALLVGPAARGQEASGAGDCQPDWLPTFGSKLPVMDLVRDLMTFDAGHGPVLYAAAKRIGDDQVHSWDGSQWTLLGDMDASVLALASFDEGQGPVLFAGGGFHEVNGLPIQSIARWDGAQWSRVGAGLPPIVQALATFDDGSGPALYAGATYLRSWDGNDWSSVTEEIWGVGQHHGVITCLLAVDDERGRVLIVGGDFTGIGGVPASHVARWDGSTWGPLGSGLDGEVRALAVFDDGSGPALYAGGLFHAAGGTPAEGIARWNGTSWSAVGGGVHGAVHALQVHHDAQGSVLYAGGPLDGAGAVVTEAILRWDGTAWSALPGHDGLANSYVDAMEIFDDGHGDGPKLVAGGALLEGIDNLGVWDGSSWSPASSGLDDAVFSVAAFDDGQGPALYVGGEFAHAGDVSAQHIARWDGSSWSTLGDGLDAAARDLAVFDDGTGAALYAAGDFEHAGGAPANHVARWNGVAWEALGPGVNGQAQELLVFDDGSGSALYVAGWFKASAGQPGSGVARWDGHAWSALGAGIHIGANDYVDALAAWMHQGQPVLVAGGNFSGAGSVTVGGLAAWDGASWFALGGGTSGNDSVRALAVFDQELFAGGDFDAIDGVPAANVARWDGAAWSPVGGGVEGGTDGIVFAFAVHDDGGGSALFAGGDFDEAGGAAASFVARWNGTSWSPLAAGVDLDVRELTSADLGGGAALYIGGYFDESPAKDSGVARWGGCPGPWSDLGFALAGIAGPPLLSGEGSLAQGTTAFLSLRGAAPASPALLFVSANQQPTPFKGGLLVPVPVLATVDVITSAAGTSSLDLGPWPGGPSGLGLVFQFGIQDATAPAGVALSNALQALVP